MKTFETIVIPARTDKRCTKIVCDLCGKEIVHEAYDVDAVKIEYEKGCRYMECGTVEVMSFDMCSDCFKNKLAPWMESQGAVASKTREEY